MKRVAIALSFLLTCSALLLGDTPNPGLVSRERAPLLQELVRLTRAGSSDVTVLAYARAHRLELPPEVSDTDLLWLRESGVSQIVVAYMTAIDVRASDAVRRESVAYGSSDDASPRAAYSRTESDDDSYGGSYPDRYAGGYSNSYDDAYPVSYDSDYYPFYGGYDPYPVYFSVNDRAFFGRFHGRGHRFNGHRGFDRGRGFRGNRGGGGRHGGPRDSWRERGSGGHGGGTTVVGPRGPGRRAFVQSGFPRRSSGPRRGAIVHRGFGHPGFSGGAHAGGSIARAPIAHSGGGRGATGSPGVRGRR
jgi:hypothetical protein